MPRGRKRLKGLSREGDQEEQTTLDRISALPDDILCHIHSFLPTKLAFATTALSRKWTSLFHFHSLTSLNFYYDGIAQDRAAIDRFVRFVDAVMHSPRDQQQLIKNLVLHCHVGILNPLLSLKVNEWVEVAKQQGVESLDIYMANKVTFFPKNIFCFRTLVVLKLSSICVVDYVYLRRDVDLPALKTLHLSLVSFKCESDYRTLLCDAPNLEDFYFAHVDDNWILPYYIESRPKLVRLHLGKCANIPSQFRITKFHNKYMTLSSPKFPNLVHIELSFGLFYGWDHILQVLHECPMLQHLVIRKDRIGYPYQNKLAYLDSSPVPECVSSHLRTCFIGSILNCEDDLHFAAYIMKKARFLQAMTMCPCLLGPKHKRRPHILKELLALSRISPECEISVLNCRFNNTSKCFQTHESFANPRDFHSLNASSYVRS